MHIILKEINDVLNKEMLYNNLSEENKKLFKTYIIQSLLKQPFYKKRYLNTFIIKTNNDFFVSILSPNEDLKNFDLMEVKHLNFESNLVNVEINEIKNIYISEDDINILIKYKQSILKAQNISEFLLLFKEDYYKILKFEFIFEEKDSLLSSLFLEQKTIFSHFDEMYFLKIKNKIIKDIDLFLNLNKDIPLYLFSEIYHTIIIFLKKHYPYILKEPNIENDISYFIIEQCEKENSDFKFKLKNINHIFIKNTDKIINKLLDFPYDPKCFNHFDLGFDYINEVDFLKKKGQSLILARKNNEMIGMILFEKKNQNIQKIISTSIKHNYRNLGLSKKLYKISAQLYSQNNFILLNEYYSEDGKNYLNKLKSKLNNDLNGCFFFDLDNSFKHMQNKNIFQEYAFSFLDIIIKLSKSNRILKNIEEIKNHYFKNVDLLMKNEKKEDITLLLEEIKKHDLYKWFP